eukprot:s1_g1720.t1
MTDRLENLVGAFANSVADAVLVATQDTATVAGPSAAALVLIQNEPGMPIETLRAGLDLTHAGAVRLINRLEAAGLVARKQSKRDRRAVALVLTVKGKTKARSVLAKRQSVVAAGLKSLTEKERAALEQIVDKLLRVTVEDLAHGYAICRLCDAEACNRCPIEAGLEESSE